MSKAEKIEAPFSGEKLVGEVERRIAALAPLLAAGKWNELALEARNLATMTEAAAELQKRLG